MTYQTAKERVARLAAGQFGRVSWCQLRWLNIPSSTIQVWLKTGYLHRVLPGVYAVGHNARTTESDLMAAVLYAGPGAMLSHGTAAWWVGLADSRPYMIDVSTPRRCLSIPGIRVHQRRRPARIWHRGVPVTPFAQTILDYAARAPLSNVRLALARADFEDGLDLAAIEAELRRGRHGAAKLRQALERHQPALARTNSGLEITLFELCEESRLPLPEINGRILGWEVDALWREQRVAVELDGPGNHRSPAQVRRDRRKELDLRAAALIVLRYSDEQIYHHPGAVVAELIQTLNRP
jgi:predicted transcriptional regulator of viral defense system